MPPDECGTRLGNRPGHPCHTGRGGVGDRVRTRSSDDAACEGSCAPEVDGPCFHEARAALDEAKRDRRFFGFRGFGAADPTLNGFASYDAALYWSWTPRQRQAALLLRQGGPALAAKHLRVSRSAVSHLARRMGWPLVAAGDSIFRTRLGDTPSPTTTATP
jgi:hypothetical protein